MFMCVLHIRKRYATFVVMVLNRGQLRADPAPVGLMPTSSVIYVLFVHAAIAYNGATCIVRVVLDAVSSLRSAYQIPGLEEPTTLEQLQHW